MYVSVVTSGRGVRIADALDRKGEAGLKALQPYSASRFFTATR